MLLGQGPRCNGCARWLAAGAAPRSWRRLSLAPFAAPVYACREASSSEPVMAAVTFTPPKQWEDWCDWAMGIWLILSPWVLLYEQDPIATRNAVTVGLLIVAAEALTLSLFRVWEEWINVALGAWLLVSPWLLGIASTAAKLNFVVVGLLVAALALYEVWSDHPDEQS